MKQIKEFKILQSGLSSVKGFESAGVSAQIKYQNRLDMALIFSQSPCVGAGVFTTNKIQAACIKHNKNNINNSISAVIINSGIANACTGEEGIKACQKSAKYASKVLHINQNNVLLASTGVIGKQLPMDRIQKGIELLAAQKNSSKQNAQNVAQAIMTTDTKPKHIAIEVVIGNTPVRIGGIAKGSGMIHPNMATMLGFIITDANISQKLLQKALKKDVASTYNMIWVDGDTSTNDMVLALANAQAGNKKITDSKHKDYKTFKKALHFVNMYLAKEIARDGEGASKLICSIVKGAQKSSTAKILAKSIIASNLVKCAMFGNDANWGRIICAMGYSGAKFDEGKVNLFFKSKAGEIQILKNGCALDFSEENASKILKQNEIEVILDLQSGDKQATAFGCDLSYDYIKINADYRS
ncbi:bifunctional glutamate N-acetyltransferase/amino-acid acetyltransferase ArgJ [Helicobacter fennelliae]|uniref:Arginine biosynthesis bifunctional protein ArgJ n=1 Tax=Helicobacter fennelliae MRY12-0050 TaxID=1325130 RepID=T1CR97_9HELI|nr:bifunctional glutamate N-acetyltransferase/amino-acid acetyltransferase ArgJ [Helicobacter fennelliae]GAD19279.1 glutamate N-acetyltransferase [Helicobacter fennelliae MRY12-0050]STP08336.1 arginine biosynthesis [Helicobacter fennelliae]